MLLINSIFIGSTMIFQLCPCFVETLIQFHQVIRNDKRLFLFLKPSLILTLNLKHVPIVLKRFLEVYYALHFVLFCLRKKLQIVFAQIVWVWKFYYIVPDVWVVDESSDFFVLPFVDCFHWLLKLIASVDFALGQIKC
jgi:hypothetical protein